MGQTTERAFLRDDKTGALIVTGIADRDNKQPGMYGCSTPGATMGQITVVANRGYATRFVPSRRILLAKMAFNVAVPAGADDSYDVGLYDATGARIVSSGSVNSASPLVAGGALTLAGSTVKVVTLPQPVLLEPDTIYYAAFAYGPAGGALPQLGAVTLSAINNGRLFGNALPVAESDAKDAMFPLPAAWGALASLTSGNVLLALRES